MSAPSWGEELTGALVTELVGRQDITSKIIALATMPSHGPEVLQLTGDGGIGKTHILRSILSNLQQLQEVAAASALIDLYHFQYHVEVGLADAIYDVFKHLPMPKYEQARKDLRDKLASGEMAGIRKLRQDALLALGQDIRAASEQKRVIIVFDTAERYVYGVPDLVQPSVPLADAWEWLVQALPNWGNVLLVVAGRPESEPLFENSRDLAALTVHTIPVVPLDEQGALAYFDAVIRLARQKNKLDVADRIANLDLETKLLAYEASSGRPILLALLVDYVSITWPPRLPDALKVPRSSALTDSERSEQLNALEEELINRLVETKSLGDTVLLLGRAPKGVDAILLAKLLNLSQEEANRRLAEIKHLSFVKRRIGDDRVFLHDEMYALLRRHVYSYPEDAPAQERFDKAIDKYYDEALDQNRKRIEKLYRPIEQANRSRSKYTSVEALATARDERRVVLTEHVHYSLHRDPPKGFRYYYRCMRDAILSAEIMLERQLQAELASFLVEKDREADRRLENIDGLERSIVDGMLLVQPVARAFAEQDYDKALAKVKSAREKGANIIAADAPATDSMLDAREAYVLAYSGTKKEREDANKQLTLAIDKLVNAIDEERTNPRHSESWTWRACGVLAFAFRVRGYIRWAQSDIQQAIPDYRNSIELWRQLNVKAELATALNDLGFARAQSGQWDDGRGLVNEALAIRRSLGDVVRVALSLNTLGLIDTQQGYYQDGISHTSKALSLFRFLSNARGVGLALIARAEASRRFAVSGGILSPRAQKNMLLQAQTDVKEAVQIFTETGEKLRQVEALIELGCNLRDQVRLFPDSALHTERAKDLTARSESTLQTAAERASDVSLAKRLDALVNLAWLGYYADDADIFGRAKQQASATFPQEYWFYVAKGAPLIDREHAQVLIWPQLGKLHMLYGHIAMDAFKGKTDRLWATIDHNGKPLDDAALYYTLSLQYTGKYSPEHRDLKKIKEEIQQRVTSPTKLALEELEEFCRIVARVEKEYHFARSEMRDFLSSRTLWYGPV